MTDAGDVIKDWDRGQSDKQTFMIHWQECADYMQPDRNDYIVDRTPGQKRMTKVFEATPVWALEQFAAGLHGLLTSPSLRWFALQTEDDALNSRDDVRLWLDMASENMYSIFNGARHNFASQSHELYMDLGCIGTAVMAVLENKRSGILFSTRHLKECVLAENEEDRIDRLTRKWKWTAKQAVEQWGTAAGEKVVKAHADGKWDAKFEFMHRVAPRRQRDPQRADVRNKAFESVYVSVADKAVIAETGFDEFPYLCPRLSKVVGEIYGRSPGMTALPDVKMLNEMAKTVLKAAQKVVDPPLQLPDDGFLMPVKTTPGSLNYYRASSQNRIEPIETKGQVNLGLDLMQAIRQQIIRAFYVEWMLMPSDPTDPAAAGKGVTATYVLQQRDEKMRLLSPMLARLQSEFLGPLIDRVFAIMMRQSIAMKFGPLAPFPRPPQVLQGKRLRVEYVSPIAIAQRSTQLDAIGRLVQLAASLAQVRAQVPPGTPFILDDEAILRLASKDLHAPAVAVKTVARFAAEQQQAQQQQQEMAAHAQAASLAQTAQQGTGALKNVADAHAALMPQAA